MYWLANGLTDFPKCPTCGGNCTSFINAKKGYSKHCCCTCTQLDPTTQLKLQETSIKKYGTKNPAQAKEVQAKMKSTCLKRYGAENAFASEEIKEKIKSTNISKYGCENPQQNTEIKLKTTNTIIDKYGVTCGYLTAGQIHKSAGEKEVADYLKQFFPELITSARKVIWPFELDIYIPSLNVGIEYDGDYWHSLPDMIERDKKKDIRCQKDNIKLIRIKESDWQANSDLVKQQLLEQLSEVKHG